MGSGVLILVCDPQRVGPRHVFELGFVGRVEGGLPREQVRPRQASGGGRTAYENEQGDEYEWTPPK